MAQLGIIAKLGRFGCLCNPAKAGSLIKIGSLG